MLWDLKLSPAKENAAVKGLDAFEFVVGEVEVSADKLVEDALFCFFFTDN